RYSVLRCRAISSTIFRDLADRSIFGEVLLGTWTLTMIDVDCFKCRFYHSKSEVENFRKAPLELTAGADLIPVLGWLHRNHTCVSELVEQNLQLESVPQSKPRTGKNAVDELGPSLRRSFQSADGFGKAAFCVLSHPRGSA